MEATDSISRIEADRSVEAFCTVYLFPHGCKHGLFILLYLPHQRDSNGLH